ncbi:MAG TPA: hypothetical protein VH877_04500 [Polyangia bacterium]|nr:hypothetical protein [Polyangia bacterium]
MFGGGCSVSGPPTPSDQPDQPDLATTADGGVPMDTGGTDGGGPSPDAQGISCSPTTPTPITTLGRGVRALAVDGANVFWIAHVSGLAGAYRAPKAGGEATQLFPVRDLQDDAYDWDLVVDGDVLFLSDSGDAGVSPGSGPIWRVTSPGHATKLAEGESYPCRGAGHPRRLAIDASRVYWTEDAGRYIGDYQPSPEPTCDPNMSFRFLRSVSKSGGEVRRLARVTSINAVLGGDFAYFTNGPTLYRLPKAGGTPQPVATGLATDQPLLAIDGDQIYLGGPDGSVQVVDRNRGTIRNVAGASGEHSEVQRFAFDERYVYWASDGDGGGIRRAPKAGGAVELVVSGGTSAVAVDENYLYWDEMRRCK